MIFDYCTPNKELDEKVKILKKKPLHERQEIINKLQERAGKEDIELINHIRDLQRIGYEI